MEGDTEGYAEGNIEVVTLNMEGETEGDVEGNV